MTTKSDYTPDEWKLLMDLPPLIGSVVMASGRSGIGGSMKEAMALAQGVLNGKKGFENNALIGSLVDARVNDGEKSEVEQMIGNSYSAQSAQELVTTLLQMCEDVRVLLENKSTEDESQQYRDWAVSVGERVAYAAKEGGLIERLTKQERVSPEERAILVTVSESLGVSSPV